MLSIKNLQVCTSITFYYNSLLAPEFQNPKISVLNLITFMHTFNVLNTYLTIYC